MSWKIRNPARRCRICGNKCEKQMRYCKLCAKERREILTQRRKGAENALHAVCDHDGLWGAKVYADIIDERLILEIETETKGDN